MCARLSHRSQFHNKIKTAGFCQNPAVFVFKVFFSSLCFAVFGALPHDGRDGFFGFSNGFLQFPALSPPAPKGQGLGFTMARKQKAWHSWIYIGKRIAWNNLWSGALDSCVYRTNHWGVPFSSLRTALGEFGWHPMRLRTETQTSQKFA